MIWVDFFLKCQILINTTRCDLDVCLCSVLSVSVCGVDDIILQVTAV